MTHATGDRGQRWEVSFFNPATNDRQVYGWTDDHAAALRMADSVEKHPSWAFPQVTDRQAITGKERAFLVEMRGRLEKGRNGDATQLDYLAQMIEDWIHELTPNVELTGSARLYRAASSDRRERG